MICKIRRIAAAVLLCLLLTGCAEPQITVPTTEDSFELPRLTLPETRPVTEETTQAATLPILTLPPTEAPTQAPTQAPTEAPTLPIQTLPPIEPAGQPETYEELRPRYNMGTCRRMDRPFHILTIYLDDDESSWDAESIRFFSDQVYYAAQFMIDQAAQWGIDLEIGRSQYMSDGNMNLHYEGSVVADLYSSDVSRDVLEQAAADIGQMDVDTLYDFLTDYTKTEQVAIIVAVNKDGVSYTIPDTWCNGEDAVEYTLMFPRYLGYSDPLDLTASIAHELFHQFGAEDYYDPYGDYPQRKILAEQYYPADIMLQTCIDVNDNVVGEITAYTIGWLQEPPEMILSEGWWR